MKNNLKTFSCKCNLANLLALLLLPGGHAFAYDSGSTGADGVFNPLVDTELVLPSDGIFNYTTVLIPAGVTVTFKNNLANTPITWLATGDVSIDGKVILSGTSSADIGAAGDAAVGDDGLPGFAGPGGFGGGVGGASNNQQGSAGFGPGRGLAATGGVRSGVSESSDTIGCGGAGAGHATAGSASSSHPSWSNSDTFCFAPDDGANGGDEYGNLDILPLIGGSGGGGASGGFTSAGSGGGGGGGAILIASSISVTVNGELRADGGNSGSVNSASGGGSGGGGAGGAIRIIASTITGNGVISASAGQAGTVDISGYSNDTYSEGGNGSDGRIRLEAESLLRTAGTTPGYSLASPGDLFVAGLPAVRITSVAAVDAPPIPTGDADIVLPITTSNPVTVSVASNGVPTGNTVKITMVPATGNPVSVISSALSGTVDSATASATIDLPEGPSVLQAEVSYSVTSN